MQQIKNRKFFKKCRIGVTGIIWITGLLAAGSDSPYMPWVNGIGLILFFAATVLLGKQLESIPSGTVIAKVPPVVHKPSSRLKPVPRRSGHATTRNSRTATGRYALGI